MRVDLYTTGPEDINDDGSAPERSDLRIEDYYFRSGFLQPGSTLTWDAHFAPLNDASNPSTDSSNTTFTAEVLYAQFSNGTSWGNPDVAAVTVGQRKQSVERLQHILDLYRKLWRAWYRWGTDAYL